MTHRRDSQTVAFILLKRVPRPSSAWAGSPSAERARKASQEHWFPAGPASGLRLCGMAEAMPSRESRAGLSCYDEPTLLS
jgi:hypothetical protein